MVTRPCPNRPQGQYCERCAGRRWTNEDGLCAACAAAVAEDARRAGLRPPEPASDPQLLASADSLHGLEQLIRRYFGGPHKLILHDDGRVETGIGILLHYRWRRVGRRYRFESIA
jgi:hypothetical protein